MAGTEAGSVAGTFHSYQGAGLAAALRDIEAGGTIHSVDGRGGCSWEAGSTALHGTAGQLALCFEGLGASLLAFAWEPAGWRQLHSRRQGLLLHGLPAPPCCQPSACPLGARPLQSWRLTCAPGACRRGWPCSASLPLPTAPSPSLPSTMMAPQQTLGLTCPGCSSPPHTGGDALAQLS